MNIRYFYTILLLFLTTSFTFSQKSETAIEIDALSKYIWRDIINDFPAIQPSIDYSLPNSSLNINLWLSFNINPDYTPLESSTTLYYNWIVNKKLDLSAGLVHYSGYDGTLYFFGLPIHNWIELYTSFSVPDAILSPYMEIYYHDQTGAYTSLGLSHTFQRNKITLNTSLLTSTRFGSQFDDNGWREVGLYFGTPFSIKPLEYEVSFSHTRFPSSNEHRTFMGINITLP